MKFIKKVITPSIEGKRISFSEVNPKDFSEIVACLQRTVSYFQLSLGFTEPNHVWVSKHFQETNRESNWIFWTIREKAGGKPLVGISDIRLNHPQAEEATIELLLIDHRAQHKGYGHEALQVIEQIIFQKARIIRLGIDPKNVQAKTFWERENYSITRNPSEPDSDQLWYAKSRSWYERLRTRMD